jgi:hypothetical protein
LEHILDLDDDVAERVCIFKPEAESMRYRLLSKLLVQSNGNTDVFDKVLVKLHVTDPACIHEKRGFAVFALKEHGHVRS